MPTRHRYSDYVAAHNAASMYHYELHDRPIPTPRICAEPKCDTILSIYNPGSDCSIHEDRKPYYVRASRKRRSAYV